MKPGQLLWSYIWCHIFHTFPWRNILIIMTMQCKSLEAIPHSVFTWYVGFFLYIRSTISFYIEPFSWEYFIQLFYYIQRGIKNWFDYKFSSSLNKSKFSECKNNLIHAVNRLFFSSLLGFCWFDAVIMCKNILVINDIIIYYPTEK